VRDPPAGRRPAMRLWRARRQHDRIETLLRGSGRDWSVEFRWNDRPLVTLRFGSESDARTHAAFRLRELERVGWVSHW
jgi:hypothetical protein